MPKTLLTYTSFVMVCLLVVGTFITATTYIQLAAASIIYPFLIFLAYKVLPFKAKWKASKKPAAIPAPAVESTAKIEPSRIENVGISDIDKRVFLKMVGATGLSLFLFSIFDKRAEGMLFRNLPQAQGGSIVLQDSTGRKIDPAQNQPLDGYRISEIDDSMVSFYGFTDKDGAWYVLRIETDGGSFRYAKGDSNFPTNWANRQNLKYDYFNNVF